jgi:hypothetical protein
MVGHVGRIANQELYWPAQLKSMREELRYDHVLLKSDYWKKFAGTATKQGLCKNPPKQSVETHSAWSLLPPKDAEGVDWANMPVDHQHIEADSTGFRGYVVEFYNVISDIVVQDGYQSVLNLKVRLTHTYTSAHMHTHTHSHTT